MHALALLHSSPFILSSERLSIVCALEARIKARMHARKQLESKQESRLERKLGGILASCRESLSA